MLFRNIRSLSLTLISLLGSAAAAQTWQDITANTGAPFRGNSRTILSAGGHIYLIGGPLQNGQDQLGVLVSADGGATFSPLNAVTGAGYDLTSAINPNTLSFANGYVWFSGAAGDSTVNYLHRLVPGQTSWEQAGLSGFPPPAQLGGFGVIDQVVYDEVTQLYYNIAQIGGVSVSADGRNWERRTEGFGGIGAPSSMAAIDGTVFAIRPLSGLRRTTDSAMTWSQTGFNGIDGAHLQRIDDTISFLVPGLSATSVAWVTTDKGDTWRTVTGLPPGMTTRLSGDGELLYTATQTGRILFSATAGLSWQDLPTDGIPQGPGNVGDVFVSQVIRQGNYLYLLGQEIIDTSFSLAGRLYRLDVSGFDFRPETRIIEQPQRAGAVAGDPVTLSVFAVGVDLTYQWFRNGEPVAGATGAELVLPSATVDDAGNYTVVVSGTRGEATSAVAQVTILAGREAGRLDPSYLPDSFSGSRLRRLPDGTLLSARASSPSTFTRFDVDGQIVASRSLSAGQANAFYPEHVIIDSAGRIFSGGYTGSSSTSSNQRLRRFHADTLETDTSFPDLGGFNGTINGVAELPGRGYLVVGTFTSLGGTPVPPVLLVDYAGVPQFDFADGLAVSNVTMVHVRQDGRILIDGSHPNFSPRKLALLEPSGRPVAGFPEFTATPQRFFEMRDNRTLIVTASGSTRTLHMLRADGTLDPNFTPAGTFNNWVEGAVEQPDGRIVLVGHFTSFASQSFPGIVGLLPSGAIDTGYYTAASFNNNIVYGITYHPEGYLFLAGGTSTSSFQGESNMGVARVFGHSPGLAFISVAPSRRLAPDTSTTLRVEAGGSSAISYQWYLNGEIVPGATSSSLTLTDTSPANTGTYTVRISNDSGELFSDPIQVALFGSPEILTQPEPTDLIAGQTLTLEVEVDGVTPFTYQWFRNGQPIDGATSRELVIENAQPAITGLFSVRVFNDLGSVDSDAVEITVNVVTGGKVTAFFPNPNNTVHAVALRSDGVLVVGGTFSAVGGANASRIGFIDAATGAHVQGVTLPSLNSTVVAVGVQSDDRVIVGGNFTNASGYSRLLRLNTDGSVDTTFNPGGTGPAGNVLNMIVLSDDRILVNTPGYNGSQSTALWRLLPDGTPDPTWNIGAGPFSANNVYGMHELPDGSIIAAGAFGSFNGVTAAYMVKIKPDGTLDLDFLANRPTPNNYARAVGVQSDGKIIVAGDFGSTSPGQSYSRVLRLHPDGSVDPSFHVTNITAGGNQVHTLQVLANDKIFMGGNFQSWPGATSSQSGQRSVMLRPDGTVDTFYRPGTITNNTVDQILALPDGRAWIAGSYTSGTVGSRLVLVTVDSANLAITRQPRSSVAELGGEATFDVGVYTATPATYQWLFNGNPIPGATGESLTITGLTRESTGDYAVEITNETEVVTSRVARLHVLAEPVITAQPSAATAAPGASATFSVEALGRAPLSYEWRLNGTTIPDATGPELVLTGVTAADAGLYDVVVSNDLGFATSRVATLSVVAVVGALDPSFNLGTGPNNGVRAVTTMPDGRIVIGGDFTQYNGVSRTRFAILEEDGSLVDLPTNPSFSSRVGAIAVQPDGKILVGWNSGTRRLMPDGSTDTTFPSTGSKADAFMVSDTHVYVAGFLSGSSSLRRYDINTGELDASFAANTNEAGLDFLSANALFRQADGKILLTATQGAAMRLNPDGTLDASFVAPSFAIGGTSPQSILQTPNGTIWVSGWFRTVAGQAQRYIVRLDESGQVLPTVSDLGTGWAAYGEKIAAVGNDVFLTVGFPTTVGDTTWSSILKITADGELDTSFPAVITADSGFNLTVDAHDRVIVVGTFTTPANRIARIITRYSGETAIVGQPHAQTVAMGGRTAFSVAWVGGGSATYQWYRGGEPVEGGTGQELVIDGAAEADAGNYHVVITVGDTVLTSASAALTIEGLDPGPAGFAAWEALSALPAHLRGPLDNPAGDGIVNLLKFALGLDPAVPGTATKQVAPVDVGGVLYPVFSYTRRADLGDVTLSVEISSNASFTNELGSVLVSETNNGDGTVTVLVRSTVPYDEDSEQFMRLRATLGP